MKIILIDSGTTNSRIRLVDEETNMIIQVIKKEIGVRNTAIEGNNHRLKSAISQGVREIIEENHLKVEDIRYIAASGMITSNLGLYEIPHVTSPAGIEEFAKSSKRVLTDFLLNIPCVLIPGMKNNSVTVNDNDQLSTINFFDVMRGEEVESFGLLKQIKVGPGKGIMVLPGSHTKFIVIDQNESLLSCLSTLGGEIIQSVTKETILSDSLNGKGIEEPEEKMILKGFEAARKHGFSRALYHVRLLQIFSNMSRNERANYFAGVVLHYDIQTLSELLAETSGVKWILVGGSNPLRQSFVQLIQYNFKGYKIIEASDEEVEYSTVLGAQKIALQYLSEKIKQSSKPLYRKERLK